MRMEIRIRAFAFRGADSQIYESGRNRLQSAFPEIHFQFSDDADVLYFITGGSEAEAVGAMQRGRTYLLLAGGEGNAWAAATEVKAWADQHEIAAMLVPLDDNKGMLPMFGKVVNAFDSLNGKRAALIGEVSHWLVASAFPPERAKERFGIEIVHLPWENLPDYLSLEPDKHFAEVFENHQADNLEHEARIHAFLQKIIDDEQLDALTLECFTMVKDKDVTACLSLALLNSKGIVAACEGDLVSLAGMMLVQELTGNIPWMANVARLAGDKVLWAHCTAPLDFLSEYAINTHFETDRSAAVQGTVQGDEVTVFRLNQSLGKAFIAEGRILSRPQHDFACRTQIETTLPENDVEKLKTMPLGNHHLIISGKQAQLLQMACMYKNISVIN